MYCEKPLSLTVRQGQAMVKAVRQHKRILQTGSHYRSSPANRFACELVRNGRIGQVKRIITQVAETMPSIRGRAGSRCPCRKVSTTRCGWGPRRGSVPQDRCLYRFRFILDYSGGQTTNFGCHSNDIAQWGWHGRQRADRV